MPNALKLLKGLHKDALKKQEVYYRPRIASLWMDRFMIQI